jgi:hypothetical protein
MWQHSSHRLAFFALSISDAAEEILPTVAEVARSYTAAQTILRFAVWLSP